ncbi:MAG: glutamate-5-semialdehyde dehydrogenase [Eubacterium sp.]|nr:glutamate-5-semialdehyde dehydrogenase [Eubacterium sp.]
MNEEKNRMLESLGKKARAAEKTMRSLSGERKMTGLLHAAEALVSRTEFILKANEEDMKRAGKACMPASLQDRLALTPQRIAGMAEGMRQVASLEDPIGSIREMRRRPNGLLIGARRVPIGVIGIIYEARPNVTADAFALTFQTGNSVILKGGSDAISSNKAIVTVIRDSLEKDGLPFDAIQLIEATDRETTTAFMHLNDYVDLLIPRGGAGLIRTVKQNSSIPVIETGTGNCHVYVDESADIDMACRIIVNAKTQRLGVCNACESLVVHRDMLSSLMPALVPLLQEKEIELRCDETALPFVPGGVPASEEDWGTEYLDRILSVRTVSSLDEAITHINTYNTGHSEAIVTNRYDHAQRFLDEVDAAAVYVNASTRFTDGFEFGYGAEIGISTQKMHARGPMGLEALTTIKYVIYGNGQVRP